MSADKQMGINDTPITLQKISNALAIMVLHNPRAKRSLKVTPRIHQRLTQNNTPGGVPLITRSKLARIIEEDNDVTPAVATRTGSAILMARALLVSQQAPTAMTMNKTLNPPPAFTPRVLAGPAPTSPHINFEHSANPMVHLFMEKNISIYCKLMNNPATAEVWQTAFGRDFGGMEQGDNKTGQKGTNAMFVMTHNKKAHACRKKIFLTFANSVIAYPPQKGDPNCILMTAMGNLITYDRESSVRTTDINMAKLHWNSVVSTPNAKYMCLHIKNFYLTAALEYFKYIKMPLNLFPVWIIGQYDLTKHAKDRWVHNEMRRLIWGLPQAGILANKRLCRKLAPFWYYEWVNNPGLWYHETQPVTFTIVVDDFGVKYGVDKANVEHLIASIKPSAAFLREMLTVMAGMQANVSQSPSQAISLTQANGVASCSWTYAARSPPW